MESVMAFFPKWILKLWNALNIEVIVLWSLVLQIVLFALGSRRKYERGIRIQIIIWPAYSMADWVATVALGKLSEIATRVNPTNVNPNDVLRALWAPLLLLHLGGADTITAYSHQDVELWYRHFLGLVGHVAMAIYIIVKCWTGSWLSILTILMLVSGIIKYGERTRALWYANNENLKTDCFEPGFPKNIFKDVYFIMRSYQWFQHYKHYIADVVHFPTEEPKENEQLDSDDLFKTMEFELEFMYDVLYTKMATILTMFGCIFRVISFICTVSVLVGFSILPKSDYLKTNIASTYVLVVGAVILEVYAVVILIYSNWGILLMSKHYKNHFVAPILQSIAKKSVHKWRIWSNNVPKFNMLSFCCSEDDRSMLMRSRILKLFGMDNNFFLKKLDKYQFLTYDKFSTEFRQLILEEIHYTGALVNKRRSATIPKSLEQLSAVINSHYSFFESIAFPDGHQQNLKDIFNSLVNVWTKNVRDIGRLALQIPQAILTKRGDMALERYNLENLLQWSIEKDFGESIIIWHIATDICYYTIHANEDDENRKTISKVVSDYMMYLLVIHPKVLRVRESIFTRTANELVDLIKELQDSHLDPKKMAGQLLIHKGQLIESKPILSDSIKLADQIISDLAASGNQWKVINAAWMEMLRYAANQCQVTHHAQLLTRGGELLTIVWVLLRHSILSESHINPPV